MIGDPGANNEFNIAVYNRGAMTLQALRTRVGDADFFEILRTWAEVKKGKNVTTPQFIALAERVSGQQLDDFFDVWLYTPEKPAGIEPAAAAAAASAASAKAGDLLAQSLGDRFGDRIRTRDPRAAAR